MNEGNFSTRRRRRRRGRPPAEAPPPSAAAIIASARPPVDTSKPADVPLTAEEAAEMRMHFRFLKEHRKLLALKLNANEDLLLNAVREPTHRGVCQHLLAKVERSRVELAAQRLDPTERARLLEGIIRFSPDIAYLLLYLESLRAASRPDATAALSAALKQIDFAAVSAAQMRRVLDLMVELVAEPDRPQLLFSLLQSATFENAFDRSAEKLPPALAEIVIPLRAAHSVIVRGAAPSTDTETLARGVAILLFSHDKVLRAQTMAVRRRLFDLGLDLADDSPRKLAPGLKTLLDSFPRDERVFSENALRLCRWFLAHDLEDDARPLLRALVRDYPSFRVPGRWLEALEGKRLGQIGLGDGQGRERGDWATGILIPRQLSVWVRVGSGADAERYARATEIAKSIAVPGVAEILAHGTSEQNNPYYAIRRLGRGANEVILKGGLKRDEAWPLCGEAVRILAALADAGVKLADVRFRRFAIDESGRLWLRDLLDAVRVPVEEARAAHAELARELCIDVLARTERLVVPASLLAKIRAASDCVALARALDDRSCG